MPQAERGSRRARDHAPPAKPMRSASAHRLDRISHAASARPSGARIGPPRVIAQAATATTTQPANANLRRCSAPVRSPRFQASIGPIAITTTSPAMIGAKVALK